jgi:hypothetical protein
MNGFYGKMAYQIMPIRSDKANSIVVKTLKLVLYSSCDGVYLNFKNNSCRLDNLAISFI